MNKEQIKQFVEDNPTLVKAKPTLTKGLRVLKYNNRVFYKNLWTDELLECRGTVIDDDWNIVSRPFTKIFNYGEKKAPKIHRDEMVTASKKINGFMASVTTHKGQLLVSTTGTIDSEFADMAREVLEPKFDGIFMEGRTLGFEIVREDDPHIIVEEFGAYLLNMRLNTWSADQHAIDEDMLDEMAFMLDVKRPSWKVDTWQNIKDEVKTCNHEGYVVWTEDGREVKIKSPFYLTTKFIGRMGKNNTDQLFDKPKLFKRNIDEEFYFLIDQLTSTFTKERYMEMEKQDRIDYVRYLIECEFTMNDVDEKIANINTNDV